jgi:hypothetical protein
MEKLEWYFSKHNGLPCFAANASPFGIYKIIQTQDTKFFCSFESFPEDITPANSNFVLCMQACEEHNQHQKEKE